MRKTIITGLLLLALIPGSQLFAAEETLPPLKDGKVPQNLDELWAGFDPQKEPLEVEVLKEWEQDGIVLRIVRYQVGTFKGSPVKMAGFYGFPKGGTKLPALIQLHGGGQSASLDSVIANAKRGYASISLNWGGNKMIVGKEAWDGPQTDWGKLDATHPPQRNKSNHFAGPLTPDEFTLDPVESPRNSNWFLVLVAARRGLTFLEQQPEVDPQKLGAFGHSMGGKLSTDLSGIDKRIKAAAPSCGGSGDLLDSDTDVPGGVRSAPSKLVYNCVSDTAYIPRITCPILWVSPTNDFHAAIENMAWNWRNVPDAQLGLSITPHMNHLHTNEHALTQFLWFEQYLKGAVTLPKTPKIEMDLKTADGIPAVTVTPDRPADVKKVSIYYSIDPHTLTRFWRSASAQREGDQWKAPCPVMNPAQPIFAYADILYDTPQQYRKVANSPGSGNSDVFALSTRVVFATSPQLQAAGGKAVDKVDRMIDDGSRGWEDWFLSNWDHPPLWRASTRKLKDPKWQGPDGGRLVFEIKPQADSTLVVNITTNSWSAFLPGKPAVDYAVLKELKGSPEWQTVSVGLEELLPTDPKITAPLANWESVTDFSICPSGEIVQDGAKTKVGKAWSGPREIRNMRWEGGTYHATQAVGNTLSPEEHQKQFNDAIKKANELEDQQKKPKQEVANKAGEQ